jgi:hypothetical protein
MAGSISEAAASVIDFSSQKSAAFRNVTEEFSERYQGQVLQGIAQGNGIASNSIALLQGRGGRVDISA